MNKQRKILITTTYNEMGIIIDTKAEEVAQLDLQPTCNQLATDAISRQAAIDAVKNYWKSEVDALYTNPKYADFNEHTEACDSILTHNANICKALEKLPSEQPERKMGKWIKISPANIYECSECGKNVMTDDISAYDFCHGCGADMRTEGNDDN